MSEEQIKAAVWATCIMRCGNKNAIILHGDLHLIWWNYERFIFRDHETERRDWDNDIAKLTIDLPASATDWWIAAKLLDVI